MILLFIVLSLISEAKLAEINILNNKVPLEVELMCEHLETHNPSEDSLDKFLKDVNNVNQNLSFLDEAVLIYFFKSEVYKTFLNEKFYPVLTKITVNESAYNLTRNKLEQSNEIYSKFAKWLISKSISDLSPFVKSKVINTYQNFSSQVPKIIIENKKAQRTIKYLTPILSSFLNMSPEKFNILVSEVTLSYFNQISLKSNYYANYSYKRPDSNINSFFSVKMSPKDAQPQTSIKEDPLEKIKNINPLENASEVIDSIPVNK